jgi:hypothetical protein
MVVFRAVRVVVMVALVATSLGSGPPAAVAAGPTTTQPETGTLDGAAFKIEVPDPWNGDLVLYSHGYVVPGSPNPAQDAGDLATGEYLLSLGYALAAPPTGARAGRSRTRSRTRSTC